MSHKRIPMFKRKVISKYNLILQEVDRTTEALQKAKLEIDEKVGEFLKGEDVDLPAQFNKIDEDLELFHSKLCIIQEELENDVTFSLNDKKQEKSKDTQNGASASLHASDAVEQGESASSSSSQNDTIIYSKNIPAIVSECNTNVTLSNCAVQTNDIHNNKDMKTEGSKFSQTSKNSSVMEHVSSSDGSSVYGTVSSVCSEAHMPDKSETSTPKDSMKLINNDPANSRQNIDHCNIVRPPEQNYGEGVLRSDSTDNMLNDDIPFPNLKIGSCVSSTIQDINSPSDFWIQIDSEYAKELCPVAELVAYYDGLCDVKKNMYCLAPLKEQGGYFRAKIIEITETVSGKQKAKVLYVDLGCRGSLNSSMLKVLPSSLQRIPCMAVNCALYGVVPVTGQWSRKAVEKFRMTVEVSRTEIKICSQVDDIYFVEVTVIASIPGNHKFTYDMAQSLCEFKYALKQKSASDVPQSMTLVSNNINVLPDQINFSSNNERSRCLDVNKKSERRAAVSKVITQSAQVTGANMPNCQEGSEKNMEGTVSEFNSLGNSKERNKSAVGKFVGENVRVNVINISKHQKAGERNLCESIVTEPISLTNNKENNRYAVGKHAGESSQVSMLSISQHQNGTEVKSTENSAVLLKSHVNNGLQHHGNKNSVSHHVPSDSCRNGKVPIHDLECVTSDSSNTCNLSSEISSSNFDWHVKIPLPSQRFEKKAKFIVMISAIVSPSDFYVNLAMTNSGELDELQEHMLSVYQNFDTSALVLPPLNKLCGMFCCCRFAEDKNWYRVRVLELCSPAENEQSSVRIQYIDYGNEAEVQISELLPLKKEFASHPPFSFHCALAGIKPKMPESSCGNIDSNKWDDEAVARFKGLATFDKCYTAEIASTVMHESRKTPIPVYLWDNISAKDILINMILVEQGAADGSDLEFLNCPTEGNLQDLDQWDPMAADYNNTLNSYGVNLNDPEIATVGYKAKDEAYICKFFSATGKCYRGDKCYYQHIYAYGGATLDKEPVKYLGEVISLPEVGSFVFVVVSAMFNPGHFFVVFPYGTKSLKTIHSEIRRCVYKDEDPITEFMNELNTCYNGNSVRKENSALVLAIGDLVAVQWKDCLWYRGRICEVHDTNAPVMIYFLDYGNCEYIKRQDVYELDPQFRHFPFQAVECHLHGVEPKVSHGDQWSKESKIKFRELTEGKTLFALIKSIGGSSLYVELFSLIGNQEISISDQLIKNGYGQYQEQVDCNNSLSHNGQRDRLSKNVDFIPA